MAELWKVTWSEIVDHEQHFNWAEGSQVDVEWRAENLVSTVPGAFDIEISKRPEPSWQPQRRWDPKNNFWQTIS